jgi:hypothetical protein
MQQLSVGCDAHKHYSQLEVQDDAGLVLNRVRLEHHPGALSSFFSRLPGGTPVALERRELVLDRRRDRSRGLSTSTHQSRQGKTHDGPRQQD